jgi:filamentous hemagglutinin
VIDQIDPSGAALDAGQQAAIMAIAMLAGAGVAGALGQNVAGATTAAENQVENNDLKHLLCVLCLISPFAKGGDVVDDISWGATNTTEVLQEELKDNVQPLVRDPFTQKPPGK